jgi:fumarate reductase flavoprotein subunit
MFAAESHVQKRLHINAPRDKLFKTLMSYSHWKSNPRIVRAFIDKSADTIQWLEDMGLKFDVPRFYPDQNPAVYHVPEGGGSAFVKTLVKKCEDFSAQLLCKTGAKKILTDGRGRVTGVIAGTKEGELKIAARCVIIATGGYAGNRELMKKYYPFYTETLHVMGIPHMGDGLEMALELGAATEDLGTMHIGGPCFPAFNHLANASREPSTVWVNKSGERFVDENIGYLWPESGNALNRQPEKTSYTLFDENIKQSLIEVGVNWGGIANLGPGARLTNLEKELRAEVDKGTVKISNSWNEIAQWIGADSRVLKSSIDEYNRFCDQKHDALFSKDSRFLLPLRTPPYYAIRCVQVTHNTLGGIKVNHHMEVLDQQGKPIPGLYATGVDTGGWVSDTYCLILSGNAFGFAVNGGRIAAENAVKYLSEKRP